MPASFVTVRDIALGDLTRFPGNARRGDVSAIRSSLRRHGQYRSLVVRDTGDGLVILAGNHTRDALDAEGHVSARCEVITCSDDEARRINLADNRLAELGDYDNDELAVLLSYLDEDYEGTGWTAEDVEALITPPSGDGDPDNAPDAPAEPVTRPGDIWHLGTHRLLCGDATDLAAVERMLEGDRCDCMWTDPPYGVEYVGKTRNALTIRNDGADSLAGLLQGAWAVATAVLQPGAAFYIAHPPGALYRTFGESIAEAGWLFRQGLVWVKDTMILGHSDYHFSHEPVMYGYTAGGTGRKGRGQSSTGWYGDNSQTSVFEVPKPARSESHPTMKPVALVAPMLANSCPKRGLVYDPFAGSGSTLIAAHTLGISARVTELDPRYCDVIVRRFEAYTGIKAELLEAQDANAG